jgi:mannose-6-phosphate isomerase-like protein (cupin superfamily)
MRNALLLSLFAAALTGAAPNGVAAQSQPAPAPKPATQQPPPAAPKPTTPTTQAPAPKPAQPAAPTPAAPAPAGGTAAAPTPRRPAATPPATSRAGMAVTVTDSGGGTLGGVRVSADGPTARNGETNGSGQVSFPGMLAGVYRLRFDGEGVVAFEKEVTVKAGLVLAVDVMLTPAKKVAPPPAPAPVAPAPTVAAKSSGPAGQAQQVSVPRVLEGDFVGKNPRRESVLSCSGNTRTTMLQINQPMPERMYADADVVYYVIGGEGMMKLDGKESKLSLNDFVSIPRGGSHSFERRGTRTLILLSVLGGEACDAPK